MRTGVGLILLGAIIVTLLHKAHLWGSTQTTQCIQRPANFGFAPDNSLAPANLFLTPFSASPALLCPLVVSWFAAPFMLFGLADASEAFDLDYLLDFPLLTAPCFASWNSLPSPAQPPQLPSGTADLPSPWEVHTPPGDSLDRFPRTTA